VNRPGYLVVVTGTATEVGKTFCTATAIAELRAAGLTVAARKPLQSFAPNPDTPELTDAEVLAAATGEDPETVCAPAGWFALPMAPPMAGAALNQPVPTVAELVAATHWPVDISVGFVEGVGGPRSPLALDGDTVDLARALQPDLMVLVADAGLGVINAVLLSVAALEECGPLTVLLNRYDPANDLHVANFDWLSECGLDIVTTPQALAEKIISGRR